MTERRLHFVVRALGARIHDSLQSHEESVHDRADARHEEEGRRSVPIALFFARSHYRSNSIARNGRCPLPDQARA